MMNALNKNKEEIEKIGKDAEDSMEQGEYNLNASILEATIKTSILWCEDEIEFLDNERFIMEEEGMFEPTYTNIKEKIKQLQTHLTWLKEQEKK